MPPESPSTLQGLQQAFAAALRSGDAHPAATGTGLVIEDADERLAVYRNNAWQSFHAALAATYPVLRRRVGEDYFRQLARDYRAEHPSRSGDLHWVGREFPSWLQPRLAGTPYEWLTDLARLEWACESAMVEPTRTALELGALASIPAGHLEGTTVEFQPSLRLVRARYAIWSVWQSNQGEGPGAAVDVAAAAEHCACACVDDRAVVFRLDGPGFALLEALQRGETFGQSLDSAAADATGLARLLSWAFGERLVVALSPGAPA